MSTGKTVYGEPIYFSITIPEVKVSNLNGAVAFVTYLLSADGERILQSQGLNYIKPTAEGKVDRIPIPIRNIAITMARVESLCIDA